MEYFLGAYKKYAEFNGRARRKEYWMFYLFYILAFIILSILDGFFGTYSLETGFGLLSGIFAIGSIVPSLAIAARRLHDIDRSGWWQLLLFIPIIGAIILIIFLVLPGNMGTNRFGEDPLLQR